MGHNLYPIEPEQCHDDVGRVQQPHEPGPVFELQEDCYDVEDDQNTDDQEQEKPCNPNSR